MDISALEQHLRELTEKESIDRIQPRDSEYAAAHDSYQKFHKQLLTPGTDEVAYIFEDDYFLASSEIIGIYRHDRFVPVLPHRHNYIELNYVWDGQCIQYINGEKVICQKGDVCLLDTQAIHSIEPATENDIIINVIMRKEFFASTFLNRLTKHGILTEFLMSSVTEMHNRQHFLKFSCDDTSRLHETMRNILLEYFNRDIGYRESIDSYMVVFFTELLRIFRNSSGSESHARNLHLLSILEYIEKNQDTCTLKSTARHFGYNPKYLTTFLKEKTGRSYMEHIHEQRMNKARILLENTDIPVNEIITLCGYHNMNFFYNKFKEQQNCTPLEYRKQFWQHEHNHLTFGQ